ncbi:MFS transporter, partial [Streptomyces sp. NPDC017936]|uniref:MFS transporter n=1 Tax=Streptomyces sp. NPDC017936 TaxID=3365016 RepID=UPI00379CA342
MFSRRTTPWPLVALFTAGYLAPYLLPTVVGRLDAGLPLSATQAGAVGSALLLSSASAGFALASRVERVGARTLARIGLTLAVLGYGGAALAGGVPAVVAGAVLGGFGSGTATTVAATRIAAQPDPHRASALGLLGVSALAGAVYLTVPHLGPGHGQPLAAIALTAVAVWPLTGRLPGRTAAAPARHDAPASPRPPHLRLGLVLVAAMPCWSLVQNSLWGVSGRIGLTQAHLGETAVGAVFAVALGAGLLGVLGAGALGPRLGRAVPIGGGTVLIAGCVVVSASATGPVGFATGEIAWNTLYPIVLSYLIGLAASLDPRGRWAVLVGSASSLGTAAGPLTGSVLADRAGFPAMGLILAAGLLVVAVPMTAVALRAGGRPLLPGAVRRRGGTPAAVVAASTGAPNGSVPPIGAPEQPVVDIPVDAPAVPARGAYDTAGPRRAGGGGPPPRPPRGPGRRGGGGARRGSPPPPPRRAPRR